MKSRILAALGWRAGLSASTLSLLLVILTVMSQPAHAGVPKCYGVNDNNAALMWFMVPNTGAVPLPSSTTIVMNRGFNAEGSAYRASNRKMYHFECGGDNTGPCSLFETTIDLATQTATAVEVENNILVGSAAVEGAIWEIDPVTGQEYLYATVGESNGRIHKWDPDNSWSLEPGYPINLSGATTVLTGLAYDHVTQQIYGSVDLPSGGSGSSNNPDVFTVDLGSGVTTFSVEMSQAIDAEGLSFAADNLLYSEEDQGSVGGRTIYTVNTGTGALTAAATFGGTQDAESLACNAGERSDLGDAPAGYGYAVHSIPVADAFTSPLHLGVLPGDNDNDPVAQAGSGADGDDNLGTAPNGAGTNDEDGVTQGGTTLQNQSLQLGASYTLVVSTGGDGSVSSGFLNAWFDLNADGDFDDAGEQVATDLSIAPGGSASIGIAVPALSPAGATYARFRYSTDAGLPSADDLFGGEEAIDGEVEDYRVILAGDPIGITKDSDNGGNADGTLRPGDSVTYTIDLDPVASGSLSNLRVSDSIPVNTTYVADSDTPEADADTDPLEWRFGSTAVGVPVSVAPVSGGSTTLISAKDTYIDEDRNDENYGDSDDIEIKVDPGEDKRGLVQWDLSSLPAAATVLSARMEFYSNGNRDIIVNAQRVIDSGSSTGNWTEGDETDGQDVDWDNRTTGTAWDTAGGDFDGTDIGRFTQDDDDEWDVIVGANVQALVQNWLNGTWDNRGVILFSNGIAGDPAENDEATIRTKERDVDEAPRLIVELQGTAGTSARLDAAPTLATDGDTITVTLMLLSDIGNGTTDSVTPGALTLVDQAGGANATSCSTPASQTVTADVPNTFTYTCTAVAGTSLPSGLAFRADNITASNTSIDYIPDATNLGPKSNSVLIAPQLSFLVTVDDPLPAGVTEITNLATVTDDFRVPGTAFVTDPVVGGVNLSGNVYNDADGLTDGTVDGTGIGTAGGNQLYVNLVDGGGNVVAVASVNADGSYQLNDVPQNATYTAQLSTTAGTVGNSAPAIDLPSGWVNTGEFLGAGAGNDGTVDGALSVAVGTTDVTNVNFGIEQPPTANPVTAASQVNPGGSNQVQVPALGGTDPEDGTLGTGDTIVIQTLPDAGTEGTLYYNGTPVTAGQTITGYNPTLLTLDPVDGTLTADFTYSLVDAAGQPSPAATVTMPFSAPVPPVANDDSASNPNPPSPSNPTTITDIDGNDTDSDGTVDQGTIDLDPATPGQQTSLVVPGEGTWSVDTSSGDVTFTPDANLIGNPTSITYTIEDNDGQVSNEATLSVDYGDQTAISGQVRYDTDGDGNLGDADAGIPGVTITLRDVNNGYAIVGTAVTDANGYYSFAGLVPSTYWVQESNPPGYNSTADADGGAGFAADRIEVTLAANDVSTDNDFLDINIVACNDSEAYAALNLTSASGGGFPSSTFTGGFSHSFPTGSETFGFTFDNAYIPAGRSLDPDWAGTGSLAYTQLDGNATSNLFHSGAERYTEYSDFPPGAIINRSGAIYTIFGRGIFGINGSNGGTEHEWDLTYDFSGLANGYLPAGTLIGIVDLDGIPVDGESMLLSAALAGGASDPWMAYLDDGRNPEPGHGLAAYDPVSNSNYFNGPSASNDVIAYVTTENLASITIHATQGAGPSSVGLKFAAPVIDSTCISGSVYDDAANDNALNGQGEVGIPGVLVTLYTDPNGDGDPSDGVPVATTITTDDGSYSFPMQPVGNYVAVETDPDGAISDDDVTGNGTDNRVSVNVTDPAVAVTGRDFLDDDAPRYDVSGSVFYDGAPNDDDFGAGDTPAEGVEVILYRDISGDGVTQPGERVETTTTAADGSYSFPNLPNGDYLIVQANEVYFLSENDTDTGSSSNGAIDSLIRVTVNNANVPGNDFLEDTLVDFGDAPTDGGFAYGDVSHDISSPLYLGSIPPDGEATTEDDGTVEAAADDGSGAHDDEDGVAFYSPAGGARAELYADVSVVNDTNEVAYLCAWLDLWDATGTGDGSFDNPGDEQDSGPVCQEIADNDGTPINATFHWSGMPEVSGSTYARFRVCSTQTECSTPSSAASSGESEDYRVEFDFTPTVVTIGEVSLVAESIEGFLSGFGEDDSIEAMLALLAGFDPVLAEALADASGPEIRAALIAYLDPDGDGHVAILRWDTLQERGTIGFYVDRREGDIGNWERINGDMLPGLIAAPLGGEYLLADPEALPGETYQYQLIELEAWGTRRTYGPWTLSLPR